MRLDGAMCVGHGNGIAICRVSEQFAVSHTKRGVTKRKLYTHTHTFIIFSFAFINNYMRLTMSSEQLIFLSFISLVSFQSRAAREQDNTIFL